MAWAAALLRLALLLAMSVVMTRTRRDDDDSFDVLDDTDSMEAASRSSTDGDTAESKPLFLCMATLSSPGTFDANTSKALLRPPLMEQFERFFQACADADPELTVVVVAAQDYTEASFPEELQGFHLARSFFADEMLLGALEIENLESSRIRSSTTSCDGNPPQREGHACGVVALAVYVKGVDGIFPYLPTGPDHEKVHFVNGPSTDATVSGGMLYKATIEGKFVVLVSAQLPEGVRGRYSFNDERPCTPSGRGEQDWTLGLQYEFIRTALLRNQLRLLRRFAPSIPVLWGGDFNARSVYVTDSGETLAGCPIWEDEDALARVREPANDVLGSAAGGGRLVTFTQALDGTGLELQADDAYWEEPTYRREDGGYNSKYPRSWPDRIYASSSGVLCKPPGRVRQMGHHDTIFVVCQIE